MVRYWHLLRRIKSPSRRWVLSTVVDVLLAIEIADDAIGILARNLRDARSGIFYRGAWLSLLRKLNQFPFTLRLAFIDTLVVFLMIWILPAGHMLHFGKIAAIWVGAFTIAYSIEAASPPISRIRTRRAHWVGPNGGGARAIDDPRRVAVCKLKSWHLVAIIAILLASACAPSPRAIRAGPSETQAIYTPTSAPTPTPAPTATVDLRAAYLDEYAGHLVDWRAAFASWLKVHQQITDQGASVLRDQAVMDELTGSLVGMTGAARKIGELPAAPAGLERLQTSGEKLSEQTKAFATLYLLAIAGGDQASAELMLTALNEMKTALDDIMEVMRANGRMK